MKNLPTNSEIAPALGDPTISVTLSTWRWSGVITIVSSAICKPALPSLLKIKQTQSSIQSYYYDDEFNAEEDKTVPCSCVGCCAWLSWSRNWGNHFVTNKLFHKPVVVSTHCFAKCFLSKTTSWELKSAKFLLSRKDHLMNYRQTYSK